MIPDPSGVARPLIVAILAGLTVACASQPRDVTSETAADADYSDLHPLAQAVARAGAPACAAKVTEAAFFLTEGSGATAFWNVRSTDLLSFSLELVGPAGATSYASLSIAPGEDDACAVGYDIVTHFTASCETVASHVFPAMHVPERQPARMGMLIGPDGEHVFLMAVGEGCVAVQKEVFP